MKKNRLIKRIDHIKSVINTQMEEARIALYDLVEANGGFVFIDDGGDTIYGYALNEDDFLEEYKVKALKSCDDGDVLVYLVPILRGVQVKYTAEDIKNETDSDNWYTLGGGDGMLYAWDTIISVLESIEEYVTKK